LISRTSFTDSNSPYESAVGKRVRDSEFGQPRSDTISPNRLNSEEGIAYMPAFTDVTETKLKELEIRPILTQHFVYPLTISCSAYVGCQNFGAKCYYALRHRSTCVRAA